MTGGQEMGRDEFLKLLIAQLKNQDPLKPQDNTAFVAELAQFSNLEQAMGMNERLDLLAMQQQGLANSQVTSLVGTEATVKGSIVSLDGSGVGTQIAFSLSGASAATTVNIQDQNGQVVRTLELGGRRTGVNTLNWDGRDSTGNVLPRGPYAVSVVATNGVGAAVGVAQETSGRVDAVSFDQGYPVLHLDNGVSVPVSDLLRVKSASTNTNTSNTAT
jgi:flagellar basal-body rod modification protein FlgD